ncbi:response regulator transcription factor [Reichenbachiella agarivorans]|uniref:Response regulator transcription factor n=1 Tax=Reichenbachiella agarivorans TaxID=2979464 RepID=A0ABY6CUM4_9BACT|nr:response regulator transcription factor [Reichenbachiella agarivorans]UXP34039.1 response regulator transcription factor [Reichenbachiella agarivorans]
MKVLLTEDNKALQTNIVTYLQNEGIICECANSIQECQDKLVAFQYDIIILDRMLPDGDGIDIIPFIKSRNLSVSILIASAKDQINDKVDGLNLGADDYITKPYFMTELIARLKALYRRNKLDGNQNLVLGNITIDTDKQEVSVHNQILNLTKKEYDLLVYIYANKNRIITRPAIAEHLWGDYADSLGSLDFVYQHIKNLRKKIISAGGNDFIQTVYGSGYKYALSE